MSVQQASEFKTPNLRDQLKKSTQKLHDLLEQQEPFSELTNANDIDQTAQKSLLCFKLAFQSFLKKKSPSHEFYRASHSALSKVEPHLNQELDSKEVEGDTTHLEYLFLGSRLGNQILIKRNPKLSQVEGGDYFSAEFPTELWADFCKRATLVTDIEQIKAVTLKAQKAFENLSNAAEKINHEQQGSTFL